MEPPTVLVAVSGEETVEFWTEVRALVPPTAAIEMFHVIDDAAAHQIGLRAAHLPGRDPAHGLPPASYGAERHGAEALVADAVAALGRPASSAIARGRPGHTIVERAAERRADCVVVGVRAAAVRVAADPHSLGHAARFVVDHAPCPVLLVRR